LKQDFIVFGRALLKHYCFVGKTRHSPLSCVLSTLVRNLSKTMELNVFYWKIRGKGRLLRNDLHSNQWL